VSLLDNVDVLSLGFGVLRRAGALRSCADTLIHTSITASLGTTAASAWLCGCRVGNDEERPFALHIQNVHPGCYKQLGPEGKALWKTSQDILGFMPTVRAPLLLWVWHCSAIAELIWVLRAFGARVCVSQLLISCDGSLLIPFWLASRRPPAATIWGTSQGTSHGLMRWQSGLMCRPVGTISRGRPCLSRCFRCLEIMHTLVLCKSPVVSAGNDMCIYIFEHRHLHFIIYTKRLEHTGCARYELMHSCRPSCNLQRRHAVVVLTYFMNHQIRPALLKGLPSQTPKRLQMALKMYFTKTFLFSYECI
jgi:hypothetical protein